jgi:hypothetical protein
MSLSPSPLSIRRLFSRASIAIALAVLAVALFAAAPAFALTFNPANVISDENFRAYTCMSQADIQAFLNTQPGVLDTLITTDYAGQKKPAAQIIYEACQRWNVSPRVMLVMLQKEQSLLTRTSMVTGYKSTLDWAIGMGCPDSGVRKEQFRGFGRQVWYGAQSLDAYGEVGKPLPSGTILGTWKPGSSMKVSYPGGTTYVVPAAIATFKLYTYNPSIGAKAPYGDLSSQSASLSGNANFWMIYVRYFGDPLGDPLVKPVYRFYNKKNGAYLYTSSVSERYNLVAKYSKTWKYQGSTYSWNTSPTLNPIQVHRFYNKTNGSYLYTTNAAQVKSLQSWKNKKKWKYQGVAYRVTASKAGTVTPVYSFYLPKTKSYFLTASAWERNKYAAKRYRSTYKYRGVAYYVAK